MERLLEALGPLASWRGALGVFVAVVLILRYRVNSTIKVPKYGTDIPVLSYYSAFRFMTSPSKTLTDARKHKICRVPMLDRWQVLVHGKYSEELHRAPEDVLSSYEGIREAIQIDYILGKVIVENHLHVELIRSQFSRQLAAIFPEVREELEVALETELGDASDWVKINAMNTMTRVITQASNRVFVGLPLCRNEEWKTMNVTLTTDGAIAALIINIFPEFMKPLVGRLVSKLPMYHKRASTYVLPMIEERMQLPPEERPNDCLSWLLEAAVGDEQNPIDHVNRILSINFAAIHTSSINFTHALHSLLAYPEYLEPMRAEVQQVVDSHGWTKVAVGHMYKLDSFIKENMRIYGLGAALMSRKTMKPFTFSDGTVIPPGNIIVNLTTPVHRNPEVYQNPEEFNGFRFAEQRWNSTGEGVKTQMVATSKDYVAFGHGKHACPGRFFAANELKTLLAILILNYDMKWADPNLPPGYRPEPLLLGLNAVPNPKTEILIRRRGKKGREF